ncbi:hypothetical protein CVT25_014754 [Psilocybe cyanescens]|uniref:DUF6570 domain-containing protein n=1 Tax=Psilocybe cyanescens TaxID=93625 RepID=A0A409X8U5_PSICY|nr:hypothetical protein CVT25_014754 [Psilocybe cyanescens]
MTANVIMYSNPTVKVYHKLPPSRDEMNEVLAFVFTGPAQPTEEDFKRCPMLVRRQKVVDALEWLRLNHRDYIDLEISIENIESYPLVGVPVTVDFRKKDENSNHIASSMSMHDNEEEEGSTEGPCPFTVHGLSGVDYGNMSIQALKARALQHIESEVAFNHEQMKGGITGSFLVAKRHKFAEISRRLITLDKSVLHDVTTRLANGDHVKPSNEHEIACFKILDDLDHIGGYVKGSITSKKSNTDVSSLLSGTSVKAIVSYISDYISKPALKTYQIFASMYDVFEREDNNISNAAVKPEGSDGTDAGRRLMLKIVNSLSSKMEIGSPMASMYLLGNPDHYTDHVFVPFWWRSYVSDVRMYWMSSLDTNEINPSDVEDLQVADQQEDNVVLRRHDDTDMSLFEWIQTYERRKRTKKELEKTNVDANIVEAGCVDDILMGGGRPDTSKATSRVKCDFDHVRNTVPNFVGGPLPRRDNGNRDYYCCSMLTLFRPWRNGGDLKLLNQT